MSGAARRRGAGRANAGSASESSTSTTPIRGARRGTPSQGQVPPGGFDGPASRGSASGGGSQGPAAPNVLPSIAEVTASSPGSRRSSVTGSQQAPAQAQRKGVRLDPALDEENKPKYMDQFRNIDLPGAAFSFNEGVLPTKFKPRPGYNDTGNAVQLTVNAFKVVGFPTVPIYQYDVIIGNGNEKRGLQRKIWSSPARVNATGQEMIWDGNRLAWSLKDLGQVRLMIDLDAEQNRPAREGHENTHRLHVTRVKKLDMSYLNAFIQNKVQMDKTIIETISVFDHLLREGPSQKPQNVVQKRSLFSRNAERYNLGGGVEAFRGVYQSLRLAENRSLVVNVDVANTTFWRAQGLINAIREKWKYRDAAHLAHELRPVDIENGFKHSTAASAIQRAFRTLRVKAVYQGNPLPDNEWTVRALAFQNANQKELEWRDPVTKKKTGRMMTVAEYFFRKYNVRLQYPNLLLVEMTKKGVFYPMELLTLHTCQRYGAKLDEIQTANMIKFAVSPPTTRLNAINSGRALLDWRNDIYLRNYGLRMHDEMIKTTARLLPSPGIEFGAKKVEQPGVSGRWRLMNTKFYKPNTTALASWGIGVFPGRNTPSRPAIEKFVNDFGRAYQNHGGAVSNFKPHIMMLPPDAAQGVQELWHATGNTFKARPQLLIFLVQDKTAFHYLRIKKSCDVRYGVVSQVMQIAQVVKGQPQYYSNVLMKVNAKLGGTTAKAVPAKNSGFKNFTVPTMIIGADVSHASPGSPMDSLAAITVSLDTFGGRYAAACQTNGQRQEMIIEANWHSMLTPLVQAWSKNLTPGKLPQHVYYIRDGVSEGQYIAVMNDEVKQIRAVLSKLNGNTPWTGKLTVIIASKRHHIRAFPPKGPAADQKQNPVPGVLIEHDVTSADEFDFYLYSHIALQGTSRPVHYTVLHDEADLAPRHIQNMIYEHCYQYMRSTTSVSLHPAVYYAHLASNRAAAHVDIPAAAGPQGGAGYKQNITSSDQESSNPQPLLVMTNDASIQTAMWYI